MTDSTIKIALVDDHHLFRQGMEAMLGNEPNMEVLSTYDNANNFLKELINLEVNLVLMDIDMPEVNGIEAAKKALELQPTLKIIMLSMHHNFSTIKDAMAAKVNGYLLKTSDQEEVKEAIETVIDGKDYFTKEVKEVLIGSFQSKHSNYVVELTPREKEILALVCKEMSTQEIAEQLFISVHTVETHRRSLLSKTGCKNSVGLVRFAVEHHLL